MIANNIKILIPTIIKLRGEDIGGAFRSIIYDKLKKIHEKKSKRKEKINEKVSLDYCLKHNKNASLFMKNLLTYLSDMI